MFQKTLHPKASTKRRPTDRYRIGMTAVRPLSEFSTNQEGSTSTRARTTQQTCRNVPVAAATDVTADVTGQSKRDSVDASFCGELFADHGELLSSLSPLLFNMKVFGLYFHREGRRRRLTEAPEWNPATTAAVTRSKKLRIYATVVLILVWLNYVRFASMFTRSDNFGAELLYKITVFTWAGLLAIFQSAYYFACHTGQLFEILWTLPVTRDCVRGARRTAFALMTFIWITLIGNMCVIAYIFFGANMEYKFIFAPLFSYTHVPKDYILVAKAIGYIGFIIIFPGVYFAHSMSLVLVYMFYNQFKKLGKYFRRALGERGQFNGDLSVFRRRHQTLCHAVSKVDRFMRLSNVAGFVCHIISIIVVFYSIVFFSETMKNLVTVSTYMFWLAANVNGLLFSASAGIIVNHMVRT